MLLQEKNIALLCKHKVFTERELRARHEILLEAYVKAVHIEALTMVDMVRKDILPAVCGYGDKLAEAALHKKAALPSLKCGYELKNLENLSECTDRIYEGLLTLEEEIESVKGDDGNLAQAKAYETRVIPAMKALRGYVDLAETMTAYKDWPYPTYADLLFGIKN